MNRSCKYFSRITRHKFWWIISKSSANFSWCVYYFNMFKQRKETFGVYSRFYLVKQDWTEIGLHDNKRKIIKTVYLFVSIYYRNQFISHFIKWLLYINTTIFENKNKLGFVFAIDTKSYWLFLLLFYFLCQYV